VRSRPPHWTPALFAQIQAWHTAKIKLRREIKMAAADLAALKREYRALGTCRQLATKIGIPYHSASQVCTRHKVLPERAAGRGAQDTEARA
jgi:hypothetical protein